MQSSENPNLLTWSDPFEPLEHGGIDFQLRRWSPLPRLPRSARALLQRRASVADQRKFDVLRRSHRERMYQRGFSGERSRARPSASEGTSNEVLGVGRAWSSVVPLGGEDTYDRLTKKRPLNSPTPSASENSPESRPRSKLSLRQGRRAKKYPPRWLFRKQLANPIPSGHRDGDSREYLI